MTRSFAAAIIALAGLAACQTAPTRTSAMNGNWASADGIFVANFSEGRFTSQDPKTGKVLAEGAYTTEGDRVQMNWQSTATKQQRSATCSFTGANSVTCDQPGAGPFTLTRA